MPDHYNGVDMALYIGVSVKFLAGHPVTNICLFRLKDDWRLCMLNWVQKSVALL